MRPVTIEVVITKERIMELLLKEANKLFAGDWHIHEFDVNAIPDIKLQVNPNNKLNSWIPLSDFTEEVDDEDN